MSCINWNCKKNHQVTHHISIRCRNMKSSWWDKDKQNGVRHVRKPINVFCCTLCNTAKELKCMPLINCKRSFLSFVDFWDSFKMLKLTTNPNWHFFAIISERNDNWTLPIYNVPYPWFNHFTNSKIRIEWKRTKNPKCDSNRLIKKIRFLEFITKKNQS